VFQLHAVDEPCHCRLLLLLRVVWGGQAQGGSKLKGLSGSGGGEQDVILCSRTRGAAKMAQVLDSCVV
jgi:hypothetical protein